MSINLMELAKNAISKQVMGKIGSVLGQDEKATSGALGAALPAILGGLMNKANTPQGASELNKMLDDHDGGLLDNLDDIFSKQDEQDSLVKSGGDLLGSIFGGKQNSMFDSIAGALGMKSGLIGSLLSMLAPVVMGVLGKQKKSLGFDDSGLASLLMDQKQHLKNVDAGLMDQLGFGNLLGSGVDTAKGAAGAVGGAVAGVAGDAAVGAGESAGRAVDATGESAPVTESGVGSMLRILLPLILIAALIYFIYSMTTGNRGPTAKKVTADLTIQLDSVSASIGEIQDEDTARAAVEKINSASSMIEEMGLNEMPTDIQDSLNEPISGFLDKLKGLLETAYQLPGVRDILEPTMNSVKAKLLPFAG